MTLSELHQKLSDLEVPEETYYLHGLYGSANDSDKLALTIKKGKYALEYEIYYKERGEKQTIRTFTTEKDACLYLLEELKK